jgi:hypothetical protein
MCTGILLKQKGHPKIAKEDIEVYKWCNCDIDEIYSYFLSFIYKRNIVYKTIFSYRRGSDGYSDSTEGEYFDKISEELCLVSKGFHSFLSIERANKLLRGRGAILCIFVIPKGAKYYTNGAENCVSNKIIFKEIIQ